MSQKLQAPWRLRRPRPVAGTTAAALSWALVDVAIWAVVIYEGSLLWKELPFNVPVVTSTDLHVQGNSTYEEIAPNDPNFLAGPSGFGAQNFVPDNAAFPYSIDFENQPTASAPALGVTVSEQLDPSLDWSTFELGSIGFGNFVVNVPAGLQYYSTRVDATASLGCYVDITADLNRMTGLVTCTFTTIDPVTLDEPVSDPTAGFLPPDDADQRGEGWLTYNIAPLSTLPTGTVVERQGDRRV